MQTTSFSFNLSDYTNPTFCIHFSFANQIEHQTFQQIIDFFNSLLPYGLDTFENPTGFHIYCEQTAEVIAEYSKPNNCAFYCKELADIFANKF